MKFGDRLEATRKMVDDFHALELAELAGVSRNYVRMLERGLRERPSGETVLRIAGVLGVSAEWLVHGTGSAPSQRHVRASVTRARAAFASAA